METVTAQAPSHREILERQGYRLTGPRLRLLEAIMGQEDNFSAEDVHSQVPWVGRATVYRTLKLLVNLRLVCKMALADGTPRYTLAGPGHHHHAICVQCGAVNDFQQFTVEGMLQNLRADVQGVIVGHRIELYILCQQCWDARGAMALAM